MLGNTWERNGSLHFSNNVVSAIKSKLICGSCFAWVLYNKQKFVEIGREGISPSYKTGSTHILAVGSLGNLPEYTMGSPLYPAEGCPGCVCWSTLANPKHTGNERVKRKKVGEGMGML